MKQHHMRLLTIPIPIARGRSRFTVLTALAVVAFAIVGTMLRSTDAHSAPTSYTIWSASTLPTRAADPDQAPVELGVRFSSSVDGWVTAIRYYKSAENTGPHTGTLWSSTGEALESVTFTSETSSGWQEAALSTPVHLAKNTDYVASYRAPHGRYAADTNALLPSTPATTYALTAKRGVYTYNAGMPASTWQDANYYVDIAFTTVAPVSLTTPPLTSSTTTSPSTTSSTPTTPSTTTPPTSSTPSPVTTTQATTTTTTTPPPTAGYADASTAGVPAGVALTNSGSVTVNTAGAVLDALNISGTVTINASNVTLRRSRIVGSGYSIIRVADNATNVLIQDVEINGLGTSGVGNSTGVLGTATVLRANIWGVENGLVPGSGSVLRDNFIHDLNAPGDPHIDGIQIDGGLSNITIDHNTVDMREWGQTATVMIDNYFGPINTVAVNNNRLIGGGYTVYSDGRFTGGTIQGVSFTNNRLCCGQWGYASIDVYQPVWSNNVDDKTGAIINR